MTQRRWRRIEQIKPGDIVVYTLRSDQFPRNPEKEWPGKVLSVYLDVQRIHVALLERGFEDCEEDICFEQIIWKEEEISLLP